MLCCDTDELPAVLAGKAPMKQIDDDVLELAQELLPKIKAIKDEGQITLRVQHGWVASIDWLVRSFRKKQHTVAT